MTDEKRKQVQAVSSCRKLMVCHPVLLKEWMTNGFWDIDGATDAEIFEQPSSKMKRLLEVIKEEVQKKKQKAVVGSIHTKFLEEIGKTLTLKGIRSKQLDSKPQDHDSRKKLVDEFNDSNSPIEVLLLSMKMEMHDNSLSGACVLCVIDSHYNPQYKQRVEAKMCDLTQKHDVKVFK